MEKLDSMFVHLAAPVTSSHPFPLDPYQHFVGFYATTSVALTHFKTLLTGALLYIQQ